MKIQSQNSVLVWAFRNNDTSLLGKAKTLMAPNQVLLKHEHIENSASVQNHFEKI